VGVYLSMMPFWRTTSETRSLTTFRKPTDLLKPMWKGEIINDRQASEWFEAVC
jgi:hypothetical protein